MSHGTLEALCFWNLEDRYSVISLIYSGIKEAQPGDRGGNPETLNLCQKS